MNSRVLHILVQRALRSVAWDDPGNGEYVVIGDGSAIDVARLQTLIDTRFSAPILWLSLNRHEARSFAKHSAAEEVAMLTLPDQVVTFCDEQLSVFLQVCPIGVARTGLAQFNYSTKLTPPSQRPQTPARARR